MAIDNNNNSNSNSNIEQSSPLRMTKRIKPELWPTILERAYEKSDKVTNKRKKCATGVFYLLRNGSVLEDIISMRQGSNNINSNSNSNKRPRSSNTSMYTAENEGSDTESSRVESFTDSQQQKSPDSYFHHEFSLPYVASCYKVDRTKIRRSSIGL